MGKQQLAGSEEHTQQIALLPEVRGVQERVERLADDVELSRRLSTGTMS
jgi:hypothetical protein